MTQEQKALVYDQLIKENDRLTREISILKAQYVANIPPQIQKIINENEFKISQIVGKVEKLFMN